MPDEVWVHTAGSFLEGVYGQKGPPMFLVASLVSLYYSGSVVIKITFKWLYSVYGFPFPLSATIFTFGVEWLVAAALRLCGARVARAACNGGGAESHARTNPGAHARTDHVPDIGTQ